MKRWVFIAVRDNVVESVKVFDNYKLGSNYTNDFILSIVTERHKFMSYYPIYMLGEFFEDEDDNLKIGLYPEESIY